MKYTIEDLRNGKCAVINDGTLEELRDVLRLAFPEDLDAKEWFLELGEDDERYFLKDSYSDIWVARNKVQIPKQSVKDFLKPSLDDKIKELKELAKSQGMECDVVLSDKKKTKVKFEGLDLLNDYSMNIHFNVSDSNVDAVDFMDVAQELSNQLEKYLNEINGYELWKKELDRKLK